MKFKLTDGQEVELKINFLLLKELREKDKAAYEKGSRIIMNGVNDMEDVPGGIYAAYVCANMENHMSYDEFLTKTPFNMVNVSKVFNELYRQSEKK